MLRFANTQEEMVFWKHKYETMEKELSYWKNKCEEIEQEFEDYRQNSQMLERELEASLEQTEKANRELRTKNNRLHLDNETLREKYEVENQNFISQINELQDESKRCHAREENYVKYIRELEQKNDDLERSLRATYVSLAEFETKLNSAIEQNALLESELVDKEELKAMVQRLKDETRDLKQEIQVKERELQPDNDKVAASRRCTSFRVSSAKNTHNHDSKRLSCSNADSPLKSQTHVKSLSSGHPVLNTPTRISAMNIVGDLLRKVGALESKLANCRISPNNSHESLSNLDNGHAGDSILDDDFLSECGDGVHDVASDDENSACKRKMENGHRTPVKEVPSITITPTNRDERISHEAQSVGVKSKLPVWRGSRRCPVDIDSTAREKNSSPATRKPETGDVQVADPNSSSKTQSTVASSHSFKSRVVKKSLHSDKSNSSSCSSGTFGGTDSRTPSKKWVYCSKVDRSAYDCSSSKLKRTCVAPTKKSSFKVSSDSSSSDAAVSKDDNTSPVGKKPPTTSVDTKSTSANEIDLKNENDLLTVKRVPANSSSTIADKVHSDCVNVLKSEPKAIIESPGVGLAKLIQCQDIEIDSDRQQQPLKNNSADDGIKSNYYYDDLELSNRTKRLFDDFELSTSRYIMELDSMFDQSLKSSSDDDSEKNGFVNPLFSYKKSIANYDKQKRSTSNIDKSSVEIIKQFLSHTKSADDSKVTNGTDTQRQGQLGCVPIRIDSNSNNNNNNNSTDVASSVNDQLSCPVGNKNKSESPYTSVSAIHRVTEIVQNIGSIDCKKSVSVARKPFAKNVGKGSLRHSSNKISVATVGSKEKQEKQQDDKNLKCERFEKKSQVESNGSLKKIDKKSNSPPFDKPPSKCIQSSSNNSSIPVKCSRFRKIFGDSTKLVSDENEKKKIDINNRQKSSGLPLALLSGNIQPFYLARKNNGAPPPPKEESPTNRISRLFVDKGNSASTKSQQFCSYAQSNTRQQRPSKAIFSCSKNRLSDRKSSLLQNTGTLAKCAENDLLQSSNSSTKYSQSGALKSPSVEKRVQTSRCSADDKNDGDTSPVGNRRYTYIIYRDDENASTGDESRKHLPVKIESSLSIPEVAKLKRESTFMTNSINEKTAAISYNMPKVDPLS